MLEHHVLDAEFLERGLGALRQRLDALDGVDLPDERREHRGLVSAARANLEHLADLAPAFDEHLGHACDDVRLGNRLAESDGQRRVFVGARRQRFVDEDVAGNVADAIEDREIVDALLSQTLDQPVARARGSHADAGGAAFVHAPGPNQLRNPSSAAWLVRSTVSGVTDT